LLRQKAVREALIPQERDFARAGAHLLADVLADVMAGADR